MKRIFLTFIIIFCLMPVSVLAATSTKPTDYTLLAPIPLNGPEGNVTEETNTADFIPGLFKLIIGIATALAVVMIMFGGIKYISTDSLGGKSDARATIENAVWGLMLTLSSWLILYTINPKLVQLNFVIPPQEIRGTTTPPTLGGGGSCANCVTLGVNHKKPGENGCRPAKPADPCQVDADLNKKLIGLSVALKARNITPLYVTESYPPTVKHQNDCHKFGTCVDVQRGVDIEVYRFIDLSGTLNLKAVYEVKTEGRKNQIIDASCNAPKPDPVCKKTLGTCIAVLPDKQDPDTGVMKPQITEEHYSVYNLPACK